MKQAPIFGSKKATIAVISAVLTMLLTILPVFFPDVDPSIFQDAADFIMKIVLAYVPSQAFVDVAKVIYQKMNRIKLKYQGEKVGTVQTVLAKCRKARDVSSLSGDELAQLIVDLISLPQTISNQNHPLDGKPGLRPGEDRNLLKLFFITGYKRYGKMFDQVIASQFLNSLPS